MVMEHTLTYDWADVFSLPRKSVTENIHSQKQLANWAVDVTVEFYACLFSSSLMCDL